MKLVDKKGNIVNTNSNFVTEQMLKHGYAKYKEPKKTTKKTEE